MHQKKCKLRVNTFDVTESGNIAKIKKEIDGLKDIIKVQQTNNNITNINIINKQNNTQNNNFFNNSSDIRNIVKLRNFGNENMGAVPHDFIRGCFMNLQFRSLFENLHFDPQYPENHNIRLKSTKRKCLEIYHNDQWNLTGFTDGLHTIVQNLCNIFYQFQKENKCEVLEDMSSEELTEVLEQLDKVTEVSKASESIKKQLLFALEQNKNKLSYVNSACATGALVQ
jgi:hypothetical protein